ncbi:MAG: 16S rRNA (cytosine(1402)-N(4))-methyltransferase RsmH [Ignavibacteria bacterium]|nr:16S rRNA (cytosine(1402)-N(4))-methyltransferase RsmH [Ignavibacteria bacterium]
MEFHTPVLLKQVTDFLINKKFSQHIIVDGTAGGGGYAYEICRLVPKGSKVICIDKDKESLSFSRKKLKEFKFVDFLQGNFGNLNSLLSTLGVEKITGLVLDLGISSYQLDYEDGFSFMRETFLDMRADKNDTLTAEYIINCYSRKDLIRIFETYGEIRKPYKITDAIISGRTKKQIKTTTELTEIINSKINLHPKNKNKFFAKLFQALRIEVNNELENLNKVLEQSLNILQGGGRMVVVSYHSLEDKIVKDFFKTNSTKISVSKYKNTVDFYGLIILNKKPLVPEIAEIRSNPRSRSAKLRAAEVIGEKLQGK